VYISDTYKEFYNFNAYVKNTKIRQADLSQVIGAVLTIDSYKVSFKFFVLG